MSAKRCERKAFGKTLQAAHRRGQRICIILLRQPAWPVSSGCNPRKTRLTPLADILRH
jgi:hypothetical protein